MARIGGNNKRHGFCCTLQLTILMVPISVTVLRALLGYFALFCMCHMLPFAALMVSMLVFARGSLAGLLYIGKGFSACIQEGEKSRPSTSVCFAVVNQKLSVDYHLWSRVRFSLAGS